MMQSICIDLFFEMNYEFSIIHKKPFIKVCYSKNNCFIKHEILFDEKLFSKSYQVSYFSFQKPK